MIFIPLTGSSPLTNHVSYHVSVLGELAASLHVLAQIQPPKPFQIWADEIIERFRTEGLYSDWDYFCPLFRYGIPDFFQSEQANGAMTDSALYSYMVSIKTDRFTNNLQPLLSCWTQHHEIPQIMDDMMQDPDFVKARLNLFISSYWQLIFEGIWEKNAPMLAKEAERIQQARENLSSLLSYLSEFSPDIQYQKERNTLTFDTPGADELADELILQPSTFTWSTSCSVQDKKWYVQYPLPQF